jgi:tRNA-modifying protein YgfZ
MLDELSPDGAVPLTHWGVLRALGPDATSFLQGQLTNDVASLTTSEVRLAGFCSAKGRLQASFLVWRAEPDELLLACSASVLAATLKRLSMFVLRAKCKLSDASGEVALTGIAGPGVELLMPAATAWSKLDSNQGALLRLPDVGGVPRCIVAGPAQQLQAGATPLALDAWRALEVRSGIALIEAATVDQFVPQMLNFELVGGVDFQKGCYPGQEIVARSQYRGTIKRRMFVFTCDAPAQAGQEVFHSADAEQPAGMVVNAVPAGAGCVALVEVKLAAFDQGSLHLGSVNGPVMHVGTLPYALPSDASLRA